MSRTCALWLTHVKTSNKIYLNKTANVDSCEICYYFAIKILLLYVKIVCTLVFTCVSYAEARNRYRLDVRLSVRPSVRPSVTRWYCIKRAEYIVMLSSPHDSPFILVLCISRSSRNSDGVTPCGGAKYRWGITIARFSTNISQTIQDIAMVAMEGE